MKRHFLLILVISLLGCKSNPEPTKDTAKSNDRTHLTTTKGNKNDFDSIKTEYDSLYRLETWNETLSPLKKSRISNFKYSNHLLFKAWTWSDGNHQMSAFAIDKLAFRPEGFQHKYMINYDSIRIFTNYEHGDGVYRGIITKLTEDSLIIHWSTGDIVKYIPYYENNH